MTCDGLTRMTTVEAVVASAPPSDERSSLAPPITVGRLDRPGRFR